MTLRDQLISAAHKMWGIAARTRAHTLGPVIPARAARRSSTGGLRTTYPFILAHEPVTCTYAEPANALLLGQRLGSVR